MSEQLHRRYSDDQIKMIFDLYLRREINLSQALLQLGCSRPRFYQLLKRYREDPRRFTIAYARHTPNRHLSARLNGVIRDALDREAQLIRDPKVPIWQYNFRYLRDQVAKRIRRPLSAQTIRNRAKAWGYYRARSDRSPRPPREVATNAIGMLLQHDSSEHQWSPYAPDPWDLITTLEDHSRVLLYAELVAEETTWTHIQALESVVLNYGVGLAYYVDRFSVFRFTCHGRSLWRRERVLTDQVPTQWRQVVEKCQMQVIYALSARAKGKVERPYRWLQDRIVRRCAGDHVTTLEDARQILKEECRRSNEHQVHSTTKEIPARRFDRALREKRTCFRPFRLAAPYQSTKDIFCLHETRKVSGYNRITYDNQTIPIPVPMRPGSEVELHVIPDPLRTEVRIWYDNRVIKTYFYKPDS
jgi:hypothetical protein